MNAISIFRDFYNWTMNFRRDSDIIDAYGPFVARLEEKPPMPSYSYKLRPKGFLNSTYVPIFYTFSILHATFYMYCLKFLPRI